MRTLLMVLMLGTAAPAQAAKCNTYVAPPESRYAGMLVEFRPFEPPIFDGRSDEISDFTEEECYGENTCYYNKTAGKMILVVTFRDNYSAVIQMPGDVGDGVLLWPAACD